jgi:hypothetical protein
MGEENVNVLVEHVGTLLLKLIFEQLWVAVGVDCDRGHARREVNLTITGGGDPWALQRRSTGHGDLGARTPWSGGRGPKGWGPRT